LQSAKVPPRLLLIAQPQSYRIPAYLRAAEKLGLNTIIASEGKYSLITEVHNGLHIDLDDVSASTHVILTEAERQPFAGVLGCDDSTVELAASVASHLGLPHNPPSAAIISRRKDLARQRLAESQCSAPKHLLIDLHAPLEGQVSTMSWPAVLKPINMSASRGVIRVESQVDFAAACERIAKITNESTDPFERSHLLVEQYIDGIEVAFEGYLYDAQLQVLAIFDKPDPLVGPYFQETIYVTPSTLDKVIQHRIKRRVAEACHAFGLTTGPVHAELRIDHEDAWIIEVASRTIGGDCGRSLDNGLDMSIEEMAISLAIGKKLTTGQVTEATGVMMIPILTSGLLRRVEGLEEARRVPGIDKVDIVLPYGHELVPLPEGNQYLGYIFAHGEESETVTQSLREAYDTLTVVTAPIFKLRDRDQ